MLKLSIIIPTINRPDDLEKTLECFLIQDFKSFQIILVDQSDNDRSQYISNTYIDKWLAIKYYRFKIKSWAQARNFAIDKIDYLDDLSGSKTDTVIFLDDDVTFDANFLISLEAYILDNERSIWWTWRINSPSREIGFGKKLWIFLLWWWWGLNQQIVTKNWFNQMFSKQPQAEDIVQRTSGCGMRYRKWVFDAWHRFPKYFLKYSIMEDLFLSYEIYLDNKDNLTYTPLVEMTHHESLNRSIPNYQKIRQHCIHRYIFHKTFDIAVSWYIRTIIMLMILDLVTFRRISIVREYFKSLLYICHNKKNLNLGSWNYNKFIFDL